MQNSLHTNHKNSLNTEDDSIQSQRSAVEAKIFMLSNQIVKHSAFINEKQSSVFFLRMKKTNGDRKAQFWIELYCIA